MANAGSVVIKIDGDSSGFEKEISQIEKSVDSSATKLERSFKKAGSLQTDTAVNAINEAKKAYESSTAAISENVEKIISKNEELKNSVDDAAGNGYEKLEKSAESAASKTNRSMDGIRRSASKMATGIKSAANVAGTAIKGMTVIAGVVSAVWSAVGITSVKYNAEMEQLETSFKVMTGSADKAADVMERLRKLGATTPFATKDLASATQLLMQYGFNADEAIDRMSMLGDIAQGDSDKMMRIAAAYGQMNSAGKVSLEDVKQMIDFCHAA